MNWGRFLLVIRKRAPRTLQFTSALLFALLIGGLLLLAAPDPRLHLRWISHLTATSASSILAVPFCLLGISAAVISHQHRRNKSEGGISGVQIADQLLIALTLFLLFSGVTALMRFGLAESAKQKLEVARTYQLDKTVTEITAGVREAESGQRGYLLTGEAVFLEAYWSGLRRVSKAQTQPISEVPDNSLEAFNALVRAKESELAESIRLKQTGHPEQAIALVLTREGLIEMQRIEKAAQAFHERFSGLVKEQNSLYRKANDLVQQTILGSYALAIGLIACAAFFFHREIRARTLVEAKLRAHEAELTLRVERKAMELRASELRYGAMLEQSPIAIHVLDPEGNSLQVNAAFERMVGVTPEKMRSYNIWEDPQIDLQGTRELLRRTFSGETTMYGTVRHIPTFSAGTPLERADSKPVWAEVIAYPVKNGLGRVEEVVLLCQDVTERETALLRVKESEMSFRQLANVLPQIVFTAKPDGELDFYNDRWYLLTQSSREDGWGWEKHVHPDDLAIVVAKWNKSISEVSAYEQELRLWDSRVREYRWYLTRAVPVLDGDGQIQRWVGSTTDIQDRKAVEEQLEVRVSIRTAELQQANRLLTSREEELKRSLGERDVLFKEVHHRVKNNLQIIASLLRMKRDTLKDDAAAAGAFEDSRRRVLSMAMIHERLYAKTSVKDIALADYAKTLVDELVASYSLPDCRIATHVDVQQIFLQVDQAIPCGLILNELVTNAIKYAFVGRREGRIAISMKRSGEDLISLSVSDDGVGLPPNVNWKTSKSLGLPIVHILARQLEGTVEYHVDQGTSFVIQFRPSSS